MGGYGVFDVEDKAQSVGFRTQWREFRDDAQRTSSAAVLILFTHGPHLELCPTNSQIIPRSNATIVFTPLDERTNFVKRHGIQRGQLFQGQPNGVDGANRGWSHSRQGCLSARGWSIPA